MRSGTSGQTSARADSANDIEVDIAATASSEAIATVLRTPSR
jgi:hypothetical protein